MIRFYRIRRRLYFIKRWIKHFYQRRTRGWDDSDTWSLDHTIAKFVLPRLKLFRKIDFGYPAGLTSEEWNWILDEMIWAMEFNASGEKWESLNEDDYNRAQRGYELFGKYFLDLWW